MLSQFFRRSLPLLALAALPMACGEATTLTPIDEATELRDRWTVPVDGTIEQLFVEPGGGDVLVIHYAEFAYQISRFGADGSLRFQGLPFPARFIDAAFTSAGTTVVLIQCDLPLSLGAVELCSEAGPTHGLVEIDRAGVVVRVAPVPIAWTPVSNGGQITSMALGPDGGVFVAGSTSFGELRFDGVVVDDPGAGTEPFIAELDPNLDAKRIQVLPIDNGWLTDLAVDGSSGDVVITGQFQGTARLSGINLTSGAYERAILYARLAPDGTARWARHVAGAGAVSTYFDGDDVVLHGYGNPPYTSFDSVIPIDGPFVAHLDGRDGATESVWTTDSEVHEGDAAVADADWIAFLFTRQVETRAAYEPPVDCDYSVESCLPEPAEVEYRQILQVVDRDGEVLTEREVSTGEGTGVSLGHRLAIGSEGELYLARSIFKGAQNGDTTTSADLTKLVVAP
ncbi:MAG: hypothetical protein R3B72_30075 [Polyangiaceae bacterium]